MLSAIHSFSLGARINYIFNDVYGAYINSINNLANLTDEQIQVKKDSRLDVISLFIFKVRISNATGTRSSLFIPEEAFEQLVKMQIKVLEEPSLRCVDFVFDELQRIVNLIEVTVCCILKIRWTMFFTYFS